MTDPQFGPASQGQITAPCGCTMRVARIVHACCPEHQTFMDAKIPEMWALIDRGLGFTTKD